MWLYDSMCYHLLKEKNDLMESMIPHFLHIFGSSAGVFLCNVIIPMICNLYDKVLHLLSKPSILLQVL